MSTRVHALCLPWKRWPKTYRCSQHHGCIFSQRPLKLFSRYTSSAPSHNNNEVHISDPAKYNGEITSDPVVANDIGGRRMNHIAQTSTPRDILNANDPTIATDDNAAASPNQSVPIRKFEYSGPRDFSSHNDQPRKLVSNHNARMTDSERTAVYGVLRSHAAQGNIDTVMKLVQDLVQQQHERPSLEHYKHLILSNIDPRAGSAAMIKALLVEMKDERVMPDSGTYHNAIKALSIHPDCLLLDDILSEMRMSWIKLTANGWQDVVAGYLRAGLIEQAVESLDEMRKAGVTVQGWLYDMAVYMLCELHDVDEALNLMEYRIRAGDDKSAAGAWYYLFDSACDELHYEALEFVWVRRIAQSYLNPTSGQCLQVLNAAARQGDVQLATDVFRVLSKRATTFDSHHYELLFEAHIKADDLKTALAIFCIMSSTGIVPTKSATTSISQWLETTPDGPQKALQILEEIKEDRPIPAEAFNRIIESCVTIQGLDTALEMYNKLHRVCKDGPNVNTFNALFVGCRQEKRKDTAMFLASEMLHLKVRPNALSFDRLALTCLAADDLADALKYYGEMRKAGLNPRLGTMTHLIRNCCQAKDTRAMALVEEMGKIGFDDSTCRKMIVDSFPSSISQVEPSLRIEAAS